MRLVYGELDSVVGREHADWWAQQLPDSAVTVVPGAGHLVVRPAWADILAHLS